MNWYLTKLVYRIICGEGEHTAQFDEQLRLIQAAGEDEAFSKAEAIGHDEEEFFCNQKNQLVQWQFINVAELYKLSHFVDGAEIYSRITEADDAGTYIDFVNRKASLIREKLTHQLLHLI